MDVTVLVAVRDEGRQVAEALTGMLAQDFAGSVEYLLLDGGSTDSTLSKISHLTGDDPRFRVIVRPGWSIPERLNLGLTAARGELIARMDAHAVFPPNYLADGVRRLARGDVASVSGPQIASGDGCWSRRIALAISSPLGRGGAHFRRRMEREIEVDSGYCGIWTRSLLLAHGGWDERAIKGEDMELAFRVRRSGGQIVCVPSMAARYAPRETLSQLALQYWRYAERRAWAATLHPQILRRSHALPPALTLTLLVALLAPPGVAGNARRAIKLYCVALLLEGARVARSESRGDVVTLPLVLATMHLAWGLGFLQGVIVHAVPRVWSAATTRRGPRVPSGASTKR